MTKELKGQIYMRLSHMVTDSYGRNAIKIERATLLFGQTKQEKTRQTGRRTDKEK